MSLKILHTADWHLGQTFFEYDRMKEHKMFFRWLLQTIYENDVDVLLVCGDVFDVSNPSAASTSLYYSFLNEATSIRTDLQIIIIAGNHDSAARLEAPCSLLEAFHISVKGTISKDENNEIDFEKLIVPLKNKLGEIEAWCMAIPYLRLGDFQLGIHAENPYEAGIVAFYKDAYAFAKTKKLSHHAIIATGHLHSLNAELNDGDRSERISLGGLDCVSAEAFHQEIAYTALGHIHKAQKVARRENIRYAGSPLPMSFSETNYQHRVILVEIENGKTLNIQPIVVPVSVELIKIPKKAQELSVVLSELQCLPNSDENTDKDFAPFLEVNVLLKGPEPSLRHQVETAIVGKNVRLAKINTSYFDNDTDLQENIRTTDDLHLMQPIDIFRKNFRKRYKNDVPEELIQLFNEIMDEIHQP